MEEVIKVVQAVGFPIAMCAWFMFRIEKKLDRMNGYLNQVIGILKAKVDDEDKN